MLYSASPTILMSPIHIYLTLFPYWLVSLFFIFSAVSLHHSPNRYTAQFSMNTLRTDSSVVLGWILPEAEPELGFVTKNCVYQVHVTPVE